MASCLRLGWLVMILHDKKVIILIPEIKIILVSLTMIDWCHLSLFRIWVEIRIVIYYDMTRNVAIERRKSCWKFQHIFLRTLFIFHFSNHWNMAQQSSTGLVGRQNSTDLTVSLHYPRPSLILWIIPVVWNSCRTHYKHNNPIEGLRTISNTTNGNGSFQKGNIFIHFVYKICWYHTILVLK